MQDIPENGADLQHLDCVHSPLITSGIDLRQMWSALWSFGNHSWTAKWEQNPAPNEHIGTLQLTHSMNLFGKAFRPIDMDVTAQQVHVQLGSSITATSPSIRKLFHFFLHFSPKGC